MAKRIPLTPSQRQRADYLCDAMSGLIGVDVRTRTRQQLVVCARVMVITVLFDEGYTEKVTGEIFGITHSSTHHYKNKMREILTAPGYDHERDLWERFKKEI